MHTCNIRQNVESILREEQAKIWGLKVEQGGIQMAGHRDATREGVYQGFDGLENFFEKEGG